MGAPKNPKLSAERVSDPDAWQRRCEVAIRRARGVVQEAARELGVTRRTLTRYIEESPTLRRVLRESRKKAEAA